MYHILYVLGLFHLKSNVGWVGKNLNSGGRGIAPKKLHDFFGI